MYLRTTSRRRGDKVYQSLHLVESYRTKDGKIRQKIVVNFGPAHKYAPDQVEEMIKGLRKFFKLDEPAQQPVPPEGSQDFGATYAIFRIWEKLGWSGIFNRFLQTGRTDFDVTANLKVLVANRLLDPMAKLHILDWMEGVYFPGIDRNEIDYNHLLRSMDFLIEHKKSLEPLLVRPLLSLFDASLDLVFYDLTSCYFEIGTQDRAKNPPDPDSTLRNYGYDRDRSGCPQIVLGLVMTHDGIPLCHYVFPGETPDKSTFRQMLKDIKARFPIKRCIVVGDRGLLTQDNLEALTQEKLDYIVARPLRRNALSRKAVEAAGPAIQKAIQRFETENTPLEERETAVEVIVEDRRFVVAYKEEIAQQTKKTRTTKLKKATSYIKWRVARSVAQREGTVPVKGKAPTDQENLLHLHDYLRDRHLSRYYRLGLDQNGRIKWDSREENRRWESQIDGKLLLETTNRDLDPKAIVHQYKELQDIERCFRTLKSSLDIRPMYHRVDRRIKAHVFVCVLALQIHRLLRSRLRKTKTLPSPERVLEKLRFQRTVEACIDGKPFRGIIPSTEQQRTIYDAIGVPTPTHKHLQNPAL